MKNKLPIYISQKKKTWRDDPLVIKKYTVNKYKKKVSKFMAKVAYRAFRQRTLLRL